jgi:hypothetical protein
MGPVWRNLGPSPASIDRQATRPALTMSDESWRLLLLPGSLPRKYWNRHFDRSCSQSHREQRSGEIRFLTAAPNPPRPFGLFLSLSSRTTESTGKALS